MKKILITWTSSWIWNFLAENLKNEFKIIWISRSKNKVIWINHFSWDINDEKFLNEIYNKIDKIDYLILNAWIGYFDKFENISIKEHKEILNTNLISPIIFTSLFLNKIKSGIIFIWSVSSKKSSKFWASYSASKFGIRWFAMNLKNELSNLKVHLINPKIVTTNFHKHSKIEIVWKYEETKIEDILKVIKEIIDGKEKRFEIDL